MAQGWVTALLLAFGIAVGVIGVVAYLRLFRKEKLAATSHSRADAPPSASSSGNFGQHSCEEEPETEQDRTKG